MTVRGKDELFRSLRKSIPGVDAELKIALTKTGDEFAETAQRFVPVATQELQKSIKWYFTRNTQSDSSRSPAIVVVAGADDGDDSAYYAPKVEFGTENTPQQPFFFPAYRLIRKSFNAKVATAIRRAKKKAGLG